MLKETRGCPGKAGRVVSLEPEYERLHRKMHAQLREIYRKNGGLPIISYGYEPEKKAIVIPESQGKTLQETVDDAIGKAQQGTPMTITFAGAYAKIPSLLQGMKEIEPPDGVHVLPGPRVGDEQKNEYLERLREAAGGGYINLTETGARQDAMLKAESREDLERLVKDLPPYKPDLPGTKIYPEKKEPRAWVYSAAAVMMSIGMLLSMVFLTLTTGEGEIMFVVCWVFAVLFGAKAGWSYLLGHRKDIS